jgi:hypothetical protein
MLVFAGILAALGTSLLYATAVAFQAWEARKAPEEHTLRASLLVLLVRRPVWLIGTGLALAGWAAQVGALLLVPLTLVEPTLAASLVFLLGYGVWMLREPIGKREVISVGCVTAGIALLAWAAPDREPHHATGPRLMAALSFLGLIALAPYVVSLVRRAPAPLIAVGAGVAYAIDGLATKFFADDVSRHTWLSLVLWGAVMVSAAGIGTLSEMSALQSRPATQVAPLVLALTTLVPVALAPVLANETWSGDPWVRTALVLALALIVGGAISLGRSRPVGTVLEPDIRSRSDTGASEDDEMSDSARESVETAERGVPPKVTTTMSPRERAPEDDDESSRTAPDTALPPKARAAASSPSENEFGTR